MSVICIDEPDSKLLLAPIVATALALIVTGGWIESIYVVTNLIDNFDPTLDAVQILADQKLVIENLMSYLEQNKSDDNIQRTINDLKNLQKIYQSLATVDVGNNQNTNKENDKDVIVIGGNKKIIMTQQQFEQIKEEIAKIRNKITQAE